MYTSSRGRGYYWIAKVGTKIFSLGTLFDSRRSCSAAAPDSATSRFLLRHWSRSLLHHASSPTTNDDRMVIDNRCIKKDMMKHAQDRLHLTMAVASHSRATTCDGEEEYRRICNFHLVPGKTKRSVRGDRDPRAAKLPRARPRNASDPIRSSSERYGCSKAPTKSKDSPHPWRSGQCEARVGASRSTELYRLLHRHSSPKKPAALFTSWHRR